MKELILSFPPAGPEGQAQGLRLGGTHRVMSIQRSMMDARSLYNGFYRLNYPLFCSPLPPSLPSSFPFICGVTTKVEPKVSNVIAKHLLYH